MINVPDEVVDHVYRYLRDLPAPISLSALKDLERHVAASLSVGDFSNLGCGPFLSVITSHQKLLNQLGGGAGGVVGSQASGTDARKAKMMGVVHQLAPDLKKNEVRWWMNMYCLKLSSYCY